MWKEMNAIENDCTRVTDVTKILVLAIGILLILASTLWAADDKKGLINCNIQEASCKQAIGSRTVTLDILPRPVKAMQDLTFTVSLDGDPIRKTPFIKLNMPAMDMGKNRVELKQKKPGVYEGRGVIVRCRSGRRTWKATVAIPEIGSADFIFDVIY